MEKVLLFGGTGNLGKEIAKELKSQGYEFAIVLRNKNKAAEVSAITSNYIIADVTNPAELEGICDNFSIVISCLGKSVSPNDHSKTTFEEIDYQANYNILTEAIKSRIKKFVYVSAFQAEKYKHLEYFRVHEEFSQQLIQSGINYSIVKPPAIFCAFIDVIKMAKQGRLINIGNGSKLTNPIFEGDLAEICVNTINATNKIIEAGGREIYSRKRLNEIIQNEINPGKKLKSVPLIFIKIPLPVIKLFNKNTYDKYAFYLEVMQHDTIATGIGKMKFEDYIKLKIAEMV